MQNLCNRINAHKIFYVGLCDFREAPIMLSIELQNMLKKHVTIMKTKMCGLSVASVQDPVMFM